MNRVYIVTGDIASGKTSYVELLAKRLKLPFFTKDQIKEKLCERIGSKNRMENLTLSFAAFDMLFYISEEMIHNLENFILESNFREQELLKLKNLFVKNCYEVVIFVFKADIEILYQRFLNRIQNENRHPAHFVLNTFEEFKDYVLGARVDAYWGKIIDMDANQFDFMKSENIEILLKNNQLI